jgi:ankyrin repeat protein
MPETCIPNSFIILNFERNGFTPLMIAVNVSDQEMTNFLVSMGADVNLTNQVGGFCSLFTTIAQRNCTNDSRMMRQPVSDRPFESHAK